jgi:hypothetical protein
MHQWHYPRAAYYSASLELLELLLTVTRCKLAYYQFLNRL